MSNDRLALDPHSARMTPHGRLAARVAELEQQVQRIQLTRPAMTLPKTQRFAFVGTLGNRTYTPNGGYCLVLASYDCFLNTNTSLSISLNVDGVSRDQMDTNNTSSGQVSFGSRLGTYVAGQRTDPFVVGLSNPSPGTGGTFNMGSILVVELPYVDS